MVKFIDLWRVVCFLIVLSLPVLAQEDSTGGVDIFLIESFVPQENPSQFNLNFYTSAKCKSKIIVQNKHSFKISDSLTDNHKSVVDISAVKADSGVIPFVIEITLENGQKIQSERYEIQLPANDKPATGGGEFTSCIYGALIYAIPVVDGYNIDSKNKWGLSKELPIVSYYAGGYNYPAHYVSVEYSHIFESYPKNFMRLGWKYLINTEYGKFVTLGINGITDFKGYNGISPEISWGIFSFQDVFTVFLRYRYTTNFNDQRLSSSSLSIGLCSWFFSLHK